MYLFSIDFLMNRLQSGSMIDGAFSTLGKSSHNRVWNLFPQIGIKRNRHWVSAGDRRIEISVASTCISCVNGRIIRYYKFLCFGHFRSEHWAE